LVKYHIVTSYVSSSRDIVKIGKHDKIVTEKLRNEKQVQG